MNILSVQEIRSAEIFLANIPLNPKFKLKLPSQKQLQKMTKFQGSIFPAASQSAQKQLKKMLSLSENMKSLREEQPNSVFQMFTFALISMLYQDKYNPSIEADVDHYILQTIKCSLYSNDMDFKHIRNVGFAFDTNQLKILVYQFLSFMQQQSTSIKTNRIKCAEWIFQENSLLLSTFTLFLRFILASIGIEEAKDYSKCVNNQQAITNLIQYFDLHYRNLGGLILFYEDGLFLSILEKEIKEIVVGQYYENQREKETQKQQLQIKASVKLNMVQSVLMNAQEKTLKITNNKKGIVESDFKLFNFMLGSSHEDTKQKGLTQKQREIEQSTPHFQEITSENFKKKKPSLFKPEQIRSELQKLMMEQPPTPYLGQKKKSTFTSLKTIQPQKEDNQMPLIKVDKSKQISMTQPLKNYVSHTNFRKTTEQKEKYTKIFKDTSKKGLDGSFYSGETHCMSAQSNTKEVSADLSTQITSCNCRKFRLKKNIIISKVLQINYFPEKSERKTSYLSSFASPKFAKNSKLNSEKNNQKIHNLFENWGKETKRHQLRPYLNKSPSFLNSLKRVKTQNALEYDFSKSSLYEGKRQVFEKQDSVKSIKNLRSNQLNSCLQFEDSLKLQSKSTPKLYQNRSTKTISESQEVQKTSQQFDNIQYHRSGMPKPWQTNSNFIQQVPQYSQLNKVKKSQMSIPMNREASQKCFSPQQNTNNPVPFDPNNKSTIKKATQLNGQKSQKQVNPETKPSNVHSQELNSQRLLKGEIPLTKAKSDLRINSKQIVQKTRPF